MIAKGVSSVDSTFVTLVRFRLLPDFFFAGVFIAELSMSVEAYVSVNSLFTTCSTVAILGSPFTAARRN